MTPGDAEAVFAAGWDERALHDAVNVVCLFNFMNRLVEGHGVKGADPTLEERGVAIREGGYDPLLKFLDEAALPAWWYRNARLPVTLRPVSPMLRGLRLSPALHHPSLCLSVREPELVGRRRRPAAPRARARLGRRRPPGWRPCRPCGARTHRR